MERVRWTWVFVFCFAVVCLAPSSAADGRFGPAGLEFEVNASSGSVALARGAGGRLLGVWVTGGEVWGRLFDDPGTPSGPAFRVGDTPPGFAYAARVAAGPGRFVVTFTVSVGDRQRVAYAVYDRDGHLVGRGDAGEGIGVALAISRSGAFMIGWGVGPSLASSLRVRLFDADGVPRGDAFTLAASGQSPYRLALAPDRSDGFLAGWTDAVTLASSVRRLDANGAPAGPVLPVGGPASLCSRPTGAFVTAWQDTSNAPYGPYPLWIRHYGANDAPLGPAQQIDVDAPAHGRGVLLGCADDGTAVAAWSSEVSGEQGEIYARRYDAGGAADSPAFRVNEITEGIQLLSLDAVSVDTRGDFAIAWWDASPSFVTRLRARVYTVAPRPAKGDFDRDGHPDLVLRRVSDGQARVWTLREAVRQSNLAIVPPTPDWAWHLGGVDDFDGDGDADLLFRHQGTGQIDLWRMGGASGVERVGQTTLSGAVLPPPEWIVAATGDFDADGRPDLLWRNLNTNKLAVWLLDGTVWRATRFPTPDQALDANWKVVAAGDFDGDGHADLLFYNVVSGRVVQWLLDAALVRREGRFTTPPAAGDANWNVVAAADYGFGLRGQAGLPDLVWRNGTTGKLVVWFLDGAGARTSGVFTTPDSPSDALGWAVAGPR